MTVVPAALGELSIAASSGEIFGEEVVALDRVVTAANKMPANRREACRVRREDFEDRPINFI
jgi:hypothetical protein